MANPKEEKKLFDLRKWIPDFVIDSAKRKALCFKETLICSENEFTTNAKPVGVYCISVEPTGPQGHEFLVHIRFSATIDGCFTGTKIMSSMTEKLHCLEEKMTDENRSSGRTLFMSMQDECYRINLFQTCCCDESTRSLDLPFRNETMLLSTGASALLMRYLAITDYHGTLSFETIKIDGDVVTCDYKCSAATHVKLNERYLQVYTIEHVYHSENDLVVNMRTYLTPQGKILQHKWLDEPYVLNVHPSTNLNVITDETRVALRERWTEDIEMLSKYLDKKYNEIIGQTEYMADHPEIKQILADYVQTLLIVKPVNVMDFTIQHFKAFAKEPRSIESETVEKILSAGDHQTVKDKVEIKCGICGLCVNCIMAKKSLVSKDTKPETDKNPIYHVLITEEETNRNAITPNSEIHQVNEIQFNECSLDDHEVISEGSVINNTEDKDSL